MDAVEIGRVFLTTLLTCLELRSDLESKSGVKSKELGNEFHELLEGHLPEDVTDKKI